MKKMCETEYEVLKSEIIQLNNIEQNYIIAMYTITIAILGFAIERGTNEWIYLLPYVILISFQRIISAKKYHRLKLAAMITVYFDDLWENNYQKIENVFSKTYDKKRLKHSIIIRVSSIHLAFICSMLCMGENLYKIFLVKIEKGTFTINYRPEVFLIDFLPSIVAITLFIFQCIWSRNALDAPKVREKYIAALQKEKSI